MNDQLSATTAALPEAANQITRAVYLWLVGATGEQQLRATVSHLVQHAADVDTLALSLRRFTVQLSAASAAELLFRKAGALDTVQWHLLADVLLHSDPESTEPAAGDSLPRDEGRTRLGEPSGSDQRQVQALYSAAKDLPFSRTLRAVTPFDAHVAQIWGQSSVEDPTLPF